MTVGAILTLGLGTFSDVNHVVTLGYGTGATPTPAPAVVLTGAGEVPSWRQVISEIHRKRLAERRLVTQEKALEKIEKRITATAEKVSRSARPDGILANLWKLEEKRSSIQIQIKTLKAEISDLDYWLAVAEEIKAQDEDEDDVEVLLLQ